MSQLLTPVCKSDCKLHLVNVNHKTTVPVHMSGMETGNFCAQLLTQETLTLWALSCRVVGHYFHIILCIRLKTDYNGPRTLASA